MARHIQYNQKLADQIIRQYASGDTIEDIIKPPTMPTRITVWRWRESHPAFGSAYDLAKSAHASALVDKAMYLVMNADVKTAKLADVQQRFLTWCASKLHRDMWGDKVQLDVNIAVDLSPALLEATQRMASVGALPQVIDTQAKQLADNP